MIPSKEKIEATIREILSTVEGEPSKTFATIAIGMVMISLTKATQMMSGTLSSKEVIKATILVLRGIAKHLEEVTNATAEVIH